MDIEVKSETRLCKVGDEFGGAPAGVIAQILARRVQPYEIIFCDEQSRCLAQLNAIHGGTRKEKKK